ncbi:ComEC/Rec2 family competence protein [Candidatus Methylacidithermus pantelleriae]|uniref:ComEC/Rec2-related protein domain-containing protein n=1 Tax=Candidatus Methylacidithermus pantelleriae TaxID=2744239 RepID=A0A8J2BLL0_9BACT|nr:ComEC/Rec2 family competence protein [Candidatus Methylacidithermus pantelleriae]CAF0703461.1 membrane hypothetical protein [Candidatus Methylacidithermus pantelleriae]
MPRREDLQLEQKEVVQPARAPWFWPALVFTAGCAVSLLAPIPWALPLVAVAAVVGSWARCSRESLRGLCGFFLAVGLLGMAHGALFRLRNESGWMEGLGQKDFSWESIPWVVRVLSLPSVEEDPSGQQTQTFVAKLLAAGTESGWVPARGGIAKVRILGKVGEGFFVQPGMDLFLKGRIQSPNFKTLSSLPWVPQPMFPSPSSYTYRMWATWKNVRKLGWQEGLFWRWLRFWGKVREWIEHTLAWGLQDNVQVQRLLVAMVLGETQGLKPELAMQFQRAGLYHVFAVSGQNVLLFSQTFLFVFQTLGVSRFRLAIVSLPLLAGMVPLCAGSSSVQRAVLMTSFASLATFWCRPYNPLNAWAVALWVIVAMEPSRVFDPGLGLSFSITLALALLADPLTKLLIQPFRQDAGIQSRVVAGWDPARGRVARIFACALATTLASWMGALPWEIVCFHAISLIGPVANLCLLPVVEAIMVAASLSVAFGWFFPAVSFLLNRGNACLLGCLLSGVSFFSHFPLAILAVPTLSNTGLSEKVRLIVPSFPGGESCIVLWQGRAWIWYRGDMASYLQWIEPCRRCLGVNRWEAVCWELDATREAAQKAGVIPAGRWPLPGKVSFSGTANGDVVVRGPGDFEIRWLRPSETEPESYFWVRSLRKTAIIASNTTYTGQARVGSVFLSPQGRVEVLVQRSAGLFSWEWLRRLRPRYWLVSGGEGITQVVEEFGWRSRTGPPFAKLGVLEKTHGLELRWGKGENEEIFLGNPKYRLFPLGLATGEACWAVETSTGAFDPAATADGG